jgi:hypothetical protein
MTIATVIHFVHKVAICFSTAAVDRRLPYFPIDNARAIYTETFSKRKKKKKDGARYAMNARYAIKIKKVPYQLHTYVHNNLKQHILRK